MLEDSGQSETGMISKKERCKPDYEAMISNLQKKFERADQFKEAALEYFTGKRARNKMAELIGEIVADCNMLAGEIQSLLKAQENDQE